MTSVEPGPADLSVIVTIVDAGPSLERCLASLHAQSGSPSLEVLVPFDSTVPGIGPLQARFPDFRFVDLGVVLDGLIPQNALEQHRFYDVRRSAGLRMAQGGLVAILEDRGVPAPDWAGTMIRLHRERPGFAAIGGAVENGVNRSLNWAAFICDFGRYQPPVMDEDPEYVSDTNICYKREALDSVREFWETRRFDEAQVNWALRRSGRKLLLCDPPRTIQVREAMPASNMLRERYHWGRNFGQSRVSGMNRQRRLVLILATPLIPLVVFARHCKRQFGKGHMGEFLAASPVLLVFLICWAAGECRGYLDGTPEERFRQ